MNPEPSPADHDAINAQYEVIRELGRGGTAVVYLAKERSTGTDVAIKLIRAKYIDDDEALGRFAREARFVAQVIHPNIVPVRAVIDLGRSGLALVMAHVAGRTLKQVIRSDGRLTPAQAEQVLRDIAGALSVAHSMAIVHRDVKPENIFIDENGRGLLADFGLARSMTADTQLTMSGVAIGTPAYMAPEQIEGGDLDARGDIYSLGLVAWEMLSGHRPWDGENLYGVLYHQKHDFLPDVRDLRDDVPDRLAEVIVRSIEKDRARRWQSMRELISALDESTPIRLTPRRAPIAADTTRFVRPAEIPPATVAAASDAADAQPAPRPSPERPAIRPSVLMPVQRRPIITGFRAGVLLAGIAGVALAAAVVRGLSTARSQRAPDTTIRATLAGDVVKPVPIGAPIDSVARAAADTLRSTPTQRPPLAQLAAKVDSSRKLKTQPTESAREPLALTPVPVRQIVPSDTTANRSSPPPRPTATAVQPPAPQPSPSAATVSPPAAATATARVSIVAGGMHSCLIGADGRLFCWGNNNSGQLGIGSTTRSAGPLVVGTSARFVALSAGLSHSCAITRDGAAWCWGNNDQGQLGDRSFGQRAAPVRAAVEHVFRSISAGAGHTCGLDMEGAAWCWGSNARGQLGSGDGSMRESTTPLAAGRDARFTSIAAGWNFNCALAANGHASCWGDNSAGQLGDGTTSDQHSPTPVAADIAFMSIAAGSAHACGVAANGDAYCWGRNTNGQLGDGTSVDRSAPVRVRGTARFASISAGGVHTCAVTNEGDAYCWGRNTYGQLGTGTYTDESQPTRVAGNHVFASVRAFGSHTCGTTQSGEAFCWGYNLESQLGDGTRIHRARPVYVETPGGG